jgi:membrane fusion protein, multidrug efflux system
MSLEPPIDHNATTSQPALQTSRSSWKKALMRLVFLGLLILLVFSTWRHFHSNAGADHGQGKAKHSGASGAPKIIAVQVKTVVAGDLGIAIDALGTVVPRNSVTVHPRVDGQLISVNFTEGQVVKKGDLLMQIDPRPYQIILTQAEGQLVKNRATLAGAEQDLVRYQSLAKNGSISQQQVDQQITLVNQYKGILKSDQGQVDAANLNLTYCRVTAPVGGRLGLRLVDPGNMVRSSDPTGVVVINQFEPIDVTFSIAEDKVQRVLKQMHTGKVLHVKAFDRAQLNVLDSGHLNSVDNQIDPTTGTLKFKAAFANQANNLFPNQFVNIRMLVETQHHVTLLPSVAIQRGVKGTYVYVVKPDSTVVARVVTLGAADGDNTAVLTGLNVGERVVFDGADKLKDGGKVRVINSQSRGSSQDTSAKPSGSIHHNHNDPNQRPKMTS